MKISVLLKKFIVSFILLPSMAMACINDMDTRFLEERKFPQTTELLFGHFPTHGKEWYEWRIIDRLDKIEKNPKDWGLYDDLAIAYEKTNQHQKAIATLLEVQKQEPKRYEMLANLGTLYLHNQEYAKGLEVLRKALAINPNAHYGREKYQILLVEYLLYKYPDSKLNFPVSNQNNNFFHYLQRQDFWPKNDREKESEEIRLAVRGLLGMLRFGNSDSPILLEELTNLFSERALIAKEFGRNKLEEENRILAELAIKAIIARKLVDDNTAENYKDTYGIVVSKAEVILSAEDMVKFKNRSGVRQIPEGFDPVETKSLEKRSTNHFNEVGSVAVDKLVREAKSYTEEIRKYEKKLLSSTNKTDIEQQFNKKYYGSDLSSSAETDALKNISKIDKKSWHEKSIGLVIILFLLISPALWYATVVFRGKNYVLPVLFVGLEFYILNGFYVDLYGPDNFNNYLGIMYLIAILFFLYHYFKEEIHNIFTPPFQLSLLLLFFPILIASLLTQSPPFILIPSFLKSLNLVLAVELYYLLGFLAQFIFTVFIVLLLKFFCISLKK